MSDSFTLEEWVQALPAEFDGSDVFREEVEPLVGQLMELCQRHGFPALFQACYGQGNGTYSSMTAFGACGPERAAPRLLAMQAIASGDMVEELVSVFEATERKARRLAALH